MTKNSLNIPRVYFAFLKVCKHLENILIELLLYNNLNSVGACKTICFTFFNKN